MAFDQVISLGHRCYTWMQFRRMLLQTVGMPFDSIVADAASAAEALKHKFEGSLQPHNLHVREDFTLDSRYKIEYWHDFHDKQNPYLDLERVQQKRAFVVDRFYKLLSSNRRLLFVRHETPGFGSVDDLQQIIEAIEMHRPVGRSYFLYLSDRVSDGEDDNHTAVNVPKAMILPDASWDKAMMRIHSRERIRGYLPSLVSAYEKWPQPLQTQTLKIFGTARKRAIQLKMLAGI